MTISHLPEPEHFIRAFQSGDLIAYPTEAVFGLGCDPDNREAVMALLALKQRPVEKGVILIAGQFAQLQKYVDLSGVSEAMQARIFASWPGPSTWLLPKTEAAPDWITGGSELIAVRVTAHPLVCAMCEHVKSALVSTSANVSGEPPIVAGSEITRQFGERVVLVDGDLGGADSPSQIRHGLTGDVLRP